MEHLRKGYAVCNMIQLQHVDKGKLNKCIFKESVYTGFA